ncbi:hypothetical protein OUZ56_023084 [Daphnia magna]|uniref:Uncharacterized protein n=1 Tax=Daphnia magna TaxID=35525 RepID=A0ABR0AYF2_9CRUS|nr:hypothetical protein OUZ56_023084 [Daphnia magna]
MNWNIVVLWNIIGTEQYLSIYFEVRWAYVVWTFSNSAKIRLLCSGGGNEAHHKSRMKLPWIMECGYTPSLHLLPALELFRNHVHLVSSPRRSLVSQHIYPLPILQFRPFEGLIPFGPT